MFGPRFDCISNDPVYLLRMLTLRESEFLRHADYVKEFRTCVIKSKVCHSGNGSKNHGAPLHDRVHLPTYLEG